MSSELVCWKCGASLKAQPLPLGRRSECLACGAELHVCRLCRHFDTNKAKHCRELAAEEVQNKTRANFCDWFQPKAGAFNPSSSSDTSPRNMLGSLFGGDLASPAKPDAQSELDKLFGGD